MRKEFWIKNITKQNISLYDLNLTVKPLASINLLDYKHYCYSLEQLEKSVESGSIYKKRNKIKIRNEQPQVVSNLVSEENKSFSVPDRRRSIVSTKYEKYEELEMSDLDYIENMEVEEEITAKKKEH
jgi:hypothetical protein